MSIFAISDLHLSTLDSTDKSMEVFGRRWTDYLTKIESNWKKLVNEDDTVIIPGDVSWAISLDEAKSDLLFINSLPGKKIIGKGNHDFWWSTMRKHENFFKENGIDTISFLYNNAYEIENVIIAGTRGWYHDEDAAGAPDNADFKKLVNRESLRLRLSLDEAKKLSEETGKSIVAFMHFPPFWNGKESEELISILLEYSVKKLYYGHIHGNYTVPAEFTHQGIDMSIISADYLDFIPKIVRTNTK